MQDEKQDILYRAAAVWKELTGYHYRLTYGYKGELHQINLTFSPEDFPHLAGFHYLKDLALPRYSPRKTVDMILSGKITHETVRKGAQYRELVEPRLMALVRLKEILEQDFDLFSYVPRFYPFVTKIKANYLISSQGELTAFVFIICLIWKQPGRRASQCATAAAPMRVQWPSTRSCSCSAACGRSS